MSDDETRPIEPDAPVPPPGPEAPQQSEQAVQQAQQQQSMPQPAYAAPWPGYPAYAAQQRPRFADQVLGMRAVVAVALACLIIGGLSGWILGHAAASDNGRFGRGPGFLQRGSFPDGQDRFPNGPNGFLFGQDRSPDRPSAGPSS
jgi:uncharacterized membrane protein